MRRVLLALALVFASCASARETAPSPAPLPSASVAPGQTLGCTLVFAVSPDARCIDR